MSAVVFQFKADAADLTSKLDNVRQQLAAVGTAAQAQAAKVSSSFDASNGALSSLESAAKKVTLTLAALAAAATAYLLGVSEQAVKLGDAVQSAAGAFNSTTTTMSEIKAVADRSGLSLDDLGKAFLDIQQKAKSGDDTITYALKAIGMSATDVANLTQRELAEKMASVFSSLTDSSNKAAAGVALFGDDVAEKLVPQLDRGRDAIANLMDAAHRAGAVVGPELSAQIAGTSELWAKFKDRVAELGLTFTGAMLQNFERYKAAIDAIIAAFTDLIGNITRLVETFGDLNGAGEKNGQQLGFLTQASNYLARGIIELIARAEEMAVLFAAYLAKIGVSFDGLVNVVKAACVDIYNLADTYSNSFYNVWNLRINGLGTQMLNLVTIFGAALAGNLKGSLEAMDQFGKDKSELEKSIKDAQNPQYFPQTQDAWKKMLDGADKYKVDVAGVTQEIEKQKAAQLALLAAGGAAGKAGGGKIAAGNPTVPDKAADAAKEAKNFVDRYLDSLNKANLTEKAEAETWMKSNVERAKAVALAQLQAAADKDDVDLTEQQKQKAAQLAVQTQTLKDKVQAAKDAAQGLADTFATALDDLIVRGGKFSDVLKNVLQTLESAALKSALLGTGMFGGYNGQPAGTGGALGSMFNAIFSGFKADGGPVMGGRAYIVGERGPELFQPNGGGNIIPNGGAANSNAPSGDAPPVVVHFNLPPGTNADSFRQSEGQITAMMSRAVSRGQRYA